MFFPIFMVQPAIFLHFIPMFPHCSSCFPIIFHHFYMFCLCLVGLSPFQPLKSGRIPAAWTPRWSIPWRPTRGPRSSAGPVCRSWPGRCRTARWQRCARPSWSLGWPWMGGMADWMGGWGVGSAWELAWVGKKLDQDYDDVVHLRSWWSLEWVGGDGWGVGWLGDGVWWRFDEKKHGMLEFVKLPQFCWIPWVVTGWTCLIWS